MGNAQKFLLDNYKEISFLDDKKKVLLVQNISNKRVYVKKYLNINMMNIYKIISDIKSDFFSKIEFILGDGDTLILIEEYIQGENLSQYIKNNGVLIEDEALKYICDLCTAIEELHKRGIIHRDISPKNIMITSERNLKLIDFDISRMGNTGKSSDTVLLGTMGFAAPEQFGFAETDERTDIYSIGAVLNYMLTEKTLNEGITENAKFSEIIKKCTDISADNRYNSVKELKEKIENIMINPKNSASLISKTEKTGLRTKSIKKNKIYLYIKYMMYFVQIVMIANIFINDEIELSERIISACACFVTLIVPLWLYEDNLILQNILKLLNIGGKLRILIIFFIWIGIIIIYCSSVQFFRHPA